MNNTLLQERLIEFVANIYQLSQPLTRTSYGRYLTDQLRRSVTSSALNYGEAQMAESHRDFIHKMRICLKELKEAQITLKIINRTQNHLLNSSDLIFSECDELVAIFVTSIKTANKRIGKPSF